MTARADEITNPSGGTSAPTTASSSSDSKNSNSNLSSSDSKKDSSNNNDNVKTTEKVSDTLKPEESKANENTNTKPDDTTTKPVPENATSSAENSNKNSTEPLADPQKVQTQTPDKTPSSNQTTQTETKSSNANANANIDLNSNGNNNSNSNGNSDNNNNINSNVNTNTNSSNVNSKDSSPTNGNLNQNISTSKPQWEAGKNENTKVIGPVELNTIYKAPQNDQVTVTFTQLPANPGKLSIEEITLTDEQVASMHALSNKAYDVTSDMADGTFKYDLTLPKPKDEQKVEIKYAENVADLEKTDAPSAGLTKTDTVSVSVTLDHFTIFVVTGSVSSDCSNASFTVVAGDKCFSSIQAAINDSATVSGNTVNVKAGTYTENVTVSKAVILKAESGVYLTGLITITSDGVTVDGFDITNPNGNSGISAIGVSNLIITNNKIENIGTGLASGSAQAIGISGSNAMSNTTIIGNTISNIGSTNLKHGGSAGSSAKGIYVGDSGSTGTINGLDIENNNISKVYASTANWIGGPSYGGGAGAYGLLVNHGYKSAVSNSNLQVKNNTISSLEGLWAHAIGLEGNTPGAVLSNNTISDLTDHKTPTDAFAIYFESNLSKTTVSLDGKTLGDTSDVAVSAAWSGYENNPVVSLGEKNYIYGVNAFAKIQDAVKAVSEGGTVNVAAGTYTEVGQIVIDKNLSIVGADKTTTIIKPAQDTGSSDDPRGWFLVNSGKSFTLKNVTLDGDGYKIFQAIRSHGPSDIENNIIKNILYNPSTSYEGRGIVVYDGYTSTISNNDFSNIGRIGMFIYGTGTKAIITGNTYTGKGAGDWLDYGIELGAGADATITNNNISGNVGVATVDGSTSAGIMATTYFGAGTKATITGNTVSNCTDGVVVGYDADDSSTVVANNNKFSGNDFGVNSTKPTVDATNNWWGDQSGPSGSGTGVGDKVSANVTFSPWCLDASCSSTSDIYSGGDSKGVTLDNTNPTDVTVDNLTINDVKGSGTMFVAKYDELKDVPAGGTTFGVGNFYYNVDASGITNFPVTITIHYVDSPITDANYLDENHFSSIYYYDGSNWKDYRLDTPPSTVSIDKTNNIITATLQHLTPIVPTVDTTAPSIPTLSTPASGSSVKPARLILDWSDSVDAEGSTPVKYYYQSSYNSAVGSNNALSSPLYTSEALTDSQIDASGTADNTYYWQVKACDSLDNCSDWSGPWSVTVDSVAPTVTVNNFVTNDSTPKLTGTVDDNSATISVKINGNTFSATNKGDGTWELADNTITPALSDGTYNVEASATDTAGNTGVDSTNNELTIDTVAPNATHKYYKNGTEVSGLVYTKNINELTFDSTVADNTPSSGLKYETFSIFQANPDGTFGWNKAYCGFRQPKNTYSLAGTTNTITGKQLTDCVSSLPEGGYYVMYGEYDNAARGNDTAVTQYRDVLGLHFVIDNTPPTDPGAPTANVLSPTKQTNITWSWLASDGAISGISNYIWNLLKGGVGILTGTTTNTSLTQDLSARGDGDFALSVQAEDNAGNQSGTVQSLSTTVDTTPPAVPKTPSPADNSYVNTHDFTFSWDSVSDATIYEWEFSYSASTSGDGGSFVSRSGFHGNLTSPQVPSPGTPDNFYYWHVRAIDEAGNASAWSTPWKVTVDTVAPDTTINSGPSGLVNTQSASFAFSSPDGTASFECQLDDGGYSSCASPQNYSSLSQGNHTFYVRAKDPANNVDQTPASRSWTVDTVAPEINNISADKDYVKAGDKITITADVTDSSGINAVSADFSYNLAYSNRPSPTSVSMTKVSGNTYRAIYTVPSSWNDGVMYIKIAARDLTGSNYVRSANYDSVTVDKIAPILSSKTPFSGWYTSNQTSTFNYTDTNMADGYIAPTCDITNEGTNQTCLVTPNICDKAGNCNTASVVSNGADIDKTVPTTTDNTDNAWHNSDVTIALACDDGSAGSGCKTTYYTTDGSDPTISSATGNSVTLSTDGVYTIKYFSVDNAGNTEGIKTATNTVRIDKTAPTATVSYDKTDWTNGLVVATLNPSESVTVTNNSGKTSRTFTANGTFTFEFVDVAGNTGTAVATVGNIDTSKPESKITSPENSGSGSTISINTWIGSISGTAWDEINGSGVSSVKVSIKKGIDQYWNGTDFVTSATELLVDTVYSDGNWNYDGLKSPTTLTDDKYTITSHAIDVAGNQENSYKLIIVNDKTIPEITLAITSSDPDGKNGWYANRPEITLTANDNFDVDRIEYQLNGTSGEWLSYTGPIVLDEGIWQVYYRTIDKASNVSVVGLKNVKIDTQFPNQVDNLVANYHRNPNRVALTWDVNDQDIDLVYVYQGKSKDFVADNNTLVSTNNPVDNHYTDFNVKHGKRYYYKVITVDEAGNIGEAKTVSIRITTHTNSSGGGNGRGNGGGGTGGGPTPSLAAGNGGGGTGNGGTGNGGNGGTTGGNGPVSDAMNQGENTVGGELNANTNGEQLNTNSGSSDNTNTNINLQGGSSDNNSQGQSLFSRIWHWITSLFSW